MSTAVLEETIPEGPADQVAEFRSLMEKFIDLELRKREREADLDEIGAERERVEPLLREQMASLGMQRANCRGLTVYMKTDFYVSKKAEKDGVTTEKLIHTLRLHGLGYLVKEGYDASSLKAKIKEYKSEGIEVPPELAALLNIGEATKLATRK